MNFSINRKSTIIKSEYAWIRLPFPLTMFVRKCKYIFVTTLINPVLGFSKHLSK